LASQERRLKGIREVSSESHTPVAQMNNIKIRMSKKKKRKKERKKERKYYPEKFAYIFQFTERNLNQSKLIES
jgi:hypothetical protein